MTKPKRPGRPRLKEKQVLKRINLGFEPDLHEALVEQARLEGRTLTGQIKFILRAHCRRRKPNSLL